MAAVRHIEFVVTSSYSIWEHNFTFLTLCQIFKNIGLAVSDILGLSSFINLAWNCYSGGKIWHFGLNRGEMLKLIILTPKTHTFAWFRAFWAIVRQNRSKRVWSLHVPQKKKEIKKSQESGISPICPEVPRERIFTKLGQNIPVVDVINCHKFCNNLFSSSVWILQEVKIPNYIEKLHTVYLHLYKPML